MSNQEIADTLSVSIHTVKTQKQRAMSVLKQRFGIGTILVMFGMTDFLSDFFKKTYFLSFFLSGQSFLV